MSRALMHAWILVLTLAHGQVPASGPDRCLTTPRPIAVESIHVDVTRSSVVDASGLTRQLDTAVARMTGVRVGPSQTHATAGFAITRYVDTLQAWVSFAPSWDPSLRGITGFADDVNVWLTSPDGRFVDDSGLSLASGAAYEYVAAVLAGAPELVQRATFAVATPAALDRASVAQVLSIVRSRIGLDGGGSAGHLPALALAPAPRLRGAQLGDWQAWGDPDFSGWSHVCEFPDFGGNVLRVNVQPFVGGESLLPGRPLAERLAEHLRRMRDVIDWALGRNIHVILAFNNFVPWPAPERRWPDDGRSLWGDRSAQDELVEAWRSIARAYQGRAGLLFELMNEPHNSAIEGYAEMKSAWTALQARLVAAIRDVDPDRWVIVTPRWSEPNELFDFVLPTTDKVIVDIHAYAPHAFTNQYPPRSVSYPGVTSDTGHEPPQMWDRAALVEFLRPAVEFGMRHGVRMMCGELGASANASDDSRERWVADMLGVCESSGFDWSYWSYGAGNEFSWSFEQSPFRDTLTGEMASNQFHIQSVAAGPLARRPLAVTLRPVGDDVGATRQVFVAALVGAQWYFRTVAGWQAWSSGGFPVYGIVTLPAELTIPVLDGNLDVSRYVGAQVYVGYGVDATEMLARVRYGLAYTVR